MRKLLILLFCLCSFFSFQASAISDLEPFINFLRSTPAFMNGEVSFKAGSVLYEEGWTIVKILPNQNIEFTFEEDYLEVRPLNAFYVKYGGMRVNIKSVTWTPAGMKTVSELPADITGLSRGKVSREVADVLEGIFGRQLHRANALLKRVRTQQTLGQVFNIAKSVVYVFTRSDSTGNVSLPDYRGELGLNFLPPKARAFNLYGMRVGIRARDHYRASFRFAGNTKGIYPYSGEFVSRSGSDINQGSEYKIMKRMVLETVSLNSSGIGLKLHLGASEIIGGMLSGLEELARRRGESVSCSRCEEMASFPAIRIQVEGYVRKAIMDQVNALWQYLPGFNINPRILNAFKRHEGCRIRNLTCVQKCPRSSNNDDDVKACKNSCDRTMLACLKN
jgi:hypothetical protein